MGGYGMAAKMRELTEQNIKITDLYVAVGYNNLTSFRRAFKKKYGVAPNALRE